MKYPFMLYWLVILVIFSGCTVHPHRGKKMKRNKDPVKAVIKIVPEHRSKQVIYRSKLVGIVSIDNIGQNY